MSTITTTRTTDIKENNNTSNATQPKGHVCLFIHDVTSSSIENNKNNSIFKTKKGIVYQRVRLNGILVSQCNEKMNIWLDDGTDTIRVILSPRLLARADAPKLINSASVTVFGLVKHLKDEFTVQCGGFHVENDASNELYYNIQVLLNQPSSPPPPPVMAANNDNNDSSKDKENIKHPQKPAALFHSLSSQPSPPSHSLELNLLAIEKDSPSTPLQFAWSPEKPLATSTPLNKGFMSVKSSPLNSRINNSDQCLIEDDDSFGEMNLSFTRIENEAIRSKPQKRRWEP